MSKTTICALIEFGESFIAVFPHGGDTSMLNENNPDLIEILHVEQTLFDEICSLPLNEQRVNALFKNRNPVI